jgi:long-chain acyl-CoA synthetase
MFEILDDLAVLKPTSFMTVPRILNRIYEGILTKIQKLGKIKKFLFEKAIDAKLYNYRKYGELEHPIWDRIIFNKTKSLLGG